MPFTFFHSFLSIYSVNKQKRPPEMPSTSAINHKDYLTPTTLPLASGVPHTHVDRHGFLIECYHSTKSVLLSGSFWIGVTLSFPLEHYIWEKVWPFNELTKLLGL